jgi:hypothetical protein
MSPYEDLVSRLRARMEPDTDRLDVHGNYLASIAISLKRIADALAEYSGVQLNSAQGHTKDKTAPDAQQK